MLIHRTAFLTLDPEMILDRKARLNNLFEFLFYNILSKKCLRCLRYNDNVSRVYYLYFAENAKITRI